MRAAIPVAVVLIVAAVLALFLVTREEDEAYRVRAIFDNAGFIIAGEDVKVAGVKVGSIEDVEVTPEFKAAVVLRIDDPGYQDFRSDAKCIVRPQSLIGEKYVECEPTQKRGVGTEAPGELREIEDGPGEGQRLLPVENTERSVDLDLINNVMREPYRERLSIIVNELGIGLAGRGEDLNDVIRRANPALKEVDEVLRLLAKQNAQLESLAVDGDTIMEPLAREREHVSSAIENMSAVAEATAERRADLEANFERLPTFLRELRPTMTRLGALSDEMTPVLSDLGDVAPDINRFLLELGPFSQAGIPALDSLGEAAKIGTPAVRNSLPVVRDLREFASAARPVGKSLAEVLVSFKKNNGIERADGLHLLPGGRRQRLRLVRPLPARRPDRQPVLVLRGRPDGRLLGELPQAAHRRPPRAPRRRRATRCSHGPRGCCRGSIRASRPRSRARAASAAASAATSSAGTASATARTGAAGAPAAAARSPRRRPHRRPTRPSRRRRARRRPASPRRPRRRRPRATTPAVPLLDYLFGGPN